MWRALVFLGLLAIAAFAAVWLAESPGDVVITWRGYEARTSVAVMAILVVAAALALSMIWSIVSALLALPDRMSFAAKARRRAKGYSAVSRGLIAVGAGDPAAARRHSGEAERFLGQESLALLLKAQAAQVSGDRDGAESAFRRMADQSETRVLGLRGLYVEARRRGDEAAARAYASEAARLAPQAGWANEALLEAQTADGDWRGALATVERRASLGLLDKTTARRHRAVLLTSEALAREGSEPDAALADAQEAVKLAPDLVPAAALAAKLMARRGDLRRAARTIEAAWKAGPHPELAEVYLHLRTGDSALDRLARAETLAKWSSWDREARLAVGRAALEAQEFAKARETVRPLFAEGATVRACLLMADIEEAENGPSGRVREWLARAARAPRDPVWIADGVVSDRWAAASPVSGRLDAFVWQTPPELLSGPGPVIDDVVGDLDLPPPALPPAPPAEVAPAEPAATVTPAAASLAPASPVAAEPPSPDAPAAGPAVPVPPAKGEEPAKAPAAPAAPQGDAPSPRPAEPRANGTSTSRVASPPLEAPVMPLIRPPDDPGPKTDEPRPARAGLFG